MGVRGGFIGAGREWQLGLGFAGAVPLQSTMIPLGGYMAFCWRATAATGVRAVAWRLSLTIECVPSRPGECMQRKWNRVPGRSSERAHAAAARRRRGRQRSSTSSLGNESLTLGATLGRRARPQLVLGSARVALRAGRAGLRGGTPLGRKGAGGLSRVPARLLGDSSEAT